MTRESSPFQETPYTPESGLQEQINTELRRRLMIAEKLISELSNRIVDKDKQLYEARRKNDGLLKKIEILRGSNPPHDIL